MEHIARALFQRAASLRVEYRIEHQNDDAFLDLGLDLGARIAASQPKHLVARAK